MCGDFFFIEEKSDSMVNYYLCTSHDIHLRTKKRNEKGSSKTKTLKTLSEKEVRR